MSFFCENAKSAQDTSCKLFEFCSILEKCERWILTRQKVAGMLKTSRVRKPWFFRHFLIAFKNSKFRQFQVCYQPATKNGCEKGRSRGAPREWPFCRSNFLTYFTHLIFFSKMQKFGTHFRLAHFFIPHVRIYMYAYV